MMEGSQGRPAASLETGKKLRRPGGSLPALIASTLRSPALTKLPPRELELATIVYLNTGITAKEVEDALSTQISNAAIRSMLNRLVAKGILRRRKSVGKFYYSPALLLPTVQDQALERVVHDYFAGSMAEAFHRFVGLVRATHPDMLTSMPGQMAGLGQAQPIAVGFGR